MLRKCCKYPLAAIIDGVISVDDNPVSVIHTDTSLAFRLDVDTRDYQIQRYISDMLAPSSVEYLDTNTLSKENVFDMLNPLTSRFVTDSSMRNNLLSALIAEANKRKSELAENAKRDELKKKYDEFISKLS